MADVKLNPVFEAFKKQIGDLVFYQLNGKTHVRRKGSPKNPKTPEQLLVRNSLSELVRDWSSMNGIMHLGWQAWASKKKMKGNNAYSSENFEKQRSGEPVELFKQVGTLKLSSFSALPGQSGEITCSFEITGGNAGRYINFFTKRRDNGALGEGFTIHSSAVSPESPFTINGLIPDAEYFVYAAVTNSEYDNATEVSASRGVICAAGS